MMDEYINRERLIEAIKNDCLEQVFYTKEDAINCIEAAPAEDVEPVVHAKWKTEYDESGWLKHTCTRCGYTKRTDVHVSLDWKHCLNCGAKMDLDD